MHIFISHSSKDNTITKQIAEGLRTRGFKIWLDLDALRDGDRWLRQLQDEIDRCAGVIVVLSRAARDSEWVERETLYAMERRKPIFIARVEDVPLPLHLVNLQYTDCQTDLDAALDQLAQTLQTKIAAAEPSPEPLPLPPERSPDPNEANFFAYVAQHDQTLSLIAHDLYEWAQQHALSVEFGGKHSPAFHVKARATDDKTVTVFSLIAYMRNPSVQIPLDYLAKYAPYTDRARRDAVLQAINALLPEDERFADARANRRPTFALMPTLASAEKLEAFKNIVIDIIQQLPQTEKTTS